MFNNRKIGIISVLLLSSCGGFIPLEGDYVLADFAFEDNGCGMDGDPGESNGDTVGVSYDQEADLLSVALSDEFVFDCALDGMDFACEAIDLELDQKPLDAIVSYVYSMDGSFADETSVDRIAIQIDITCVGADCAMVAGDEVSIPCSTRFAGTAHLP